MIAVVQAGVVVLALVVVFTVVGRAILAWCTPAGRPLSAGTLAGAAAIVLWLVTLSPLVAPGSGAGVASLAVAIAILLAATFHYRRAGLRPSRGEARTFIAVVVAGLACTAPILAIMSRSSSTVVVHLSGNHDAFFSPPCPVGSWVTVQSVDPTCRPPARRTEPRWWVLPGTFSSEAQSESGLNPFWPPLPGRRAWTRSAFGCR